MSKSAACTCKQWCQLWCPLSSSWYDACSQRELCVVVLTISEGKGCKDRQLGITCEVHVEAMLVGALLKRSCMNHCTAQGDRGVCIQSQCGFCMSERRPRSMPQAQMMCEGPLRDSHKRMCVQKVNNSSDQCHPFCHRPSWRTVLLAHSLKHHAETTKIRAWSIQHRNERQWLGSQDVNLNLQYVPAGVEQEASTSKEKRIHACA